MYSYYRLILYTILYYFRPYVCMLIDEKQERHKSIFNDNKIICQIVYKWWKLRINATLSSNNL